MAIASATSDAALATLTPGDGDPLTVADVVAGYRGAPPVLHGISLAVAPGEVLAVLGRNGAGKTTLLRTISGVLPCRAGRVALGDRQISGMAAHRVASCGIAHVPEGRRVIPGMTVEDNLRLGGYALRKRAAVEEQLARVLEFFPMLERWRHRGAASLSGGEQQMLAIARALMGRAGIVLLDEPLTGLAPIFRAEVLAVVDALRAAGHGILIVEQNAAETLPHADRALVIQEGRIALSGPAGELADSSAMQEEYLGVPIGGRAGVPQPPMEEER
jgi:branched-chain amino acid transport system ATP-binding protein